MVHAGFESQQAIVPVTAFIQVSTSVDSEEQAKKIGRKLLNERVASCVQILGPIQSNYWWKERIERAREWICLIKARTDDYHRIETIIKKLHPYEIPEILAFPVLYGDNDYLRWIRNETDHKLKPSAKRNRA